jgi:hypothetical protein
MLIADQEKGRICDSWWYFTKDVISNQTFRRLAWWKQIKLLLENQNPQQINNMLQVLVQKTNLFEIGYD